VVFVEVEGHGQAPDDAGHKEVGAEDGLGASVCATAKGKGAGSEQGWGMVHGGLLKVLRESVFDAAFG